MVFKVQLIQITFLALEEYSYRFPLLVALIFPSSERQTSWLKALFALWDFEYRTRRFQNLPIEERSSMAVGV
jgi:hypothetical protein